MQHPRGVANAARIQGHIHDLSLAVRRLPGVGIVQEKRPSTIRAGAAPIALLALSCRAMSHNISALTVGAVQDLDHHDATRSCWGSLSHLLLKGSRSTPLEHLHFCLPHTSLRHPLLPPEPTHSTGSAKRWQPRTPAMAAGLTDHVWTLREVLLFRVPPWPQPAQV